MHAIDYFVVERWMITELGLKNYELLLYADLYRFATVHGGVGYEISPMFVVNKLGLTEKKATALLNRLVKKGLFSKRNVTVGNVKVCKYSCLLPPYSKKQSEPLAENQPSERFKEKGDTNGTV